MLCFTFALNYQGIYCEIVLATIDSCFSSTFSHQELVFKTLLFDLIIEKTQVPIAKNLYLNK